MYLPRSGPANLSEEDDQELELYWDATYAIAISLMTHHPDLQPEYVGLNELVELIINLPGFQDDPALVTERILQDIQITWFEEATS
jgi:FeS assembly protein IscX